MRVNINKNDYSCSRGVPFQDAVFGVYVALDVCYNAAISRSNDSFGFAIPAVERETRIVEACNARLSTVRSFLTVQCWS